MGWAPDSEVYDFQDPTWYKAASSWLKVKYCEKKLNGLSNPKY